MTRLAKINGTTTGTVSRDWLKVSVSALALCSAMVLATPAYADRPTTSAVNSFIDSKVSDSTLRTILKGVAKAGLDAKLATSSTTATINGQVFDVNSSAVFRTIPTLKTVNATIAGHSVTISTNASSFGRATKDNVITVVVDGRTVFNAKARSVKTADLLAAWNALGQTQANQITQRETARASATATVSGISQRISFVLAPTTHKKRDDRGGKDHSDSMNQIGLSAGDGGAKISAWSNFSYNFLDNTASLSKYDGRLINGLVGSDYLMPSVGGMGDLLLGVALSEENLGLTTTFNNGTLDTNGLSIVPYLGYRMLDGKLVYDLMFSHTWLNSDTVRNRDFFQANGSYRGERNSWASNLTYNFVLNDWIVSPGIGIVYAHEIQNGFTDSNGANQAGTETYIGDAKIGGRVTHSLTSDIDVYTSHYYAYDVVPLFAKNARSCTSPLGGCSNVRDQVQSAIGVNLYQDSFYNLGDLTLTGEVGHVFRDTTPSTSVTASARLTF